MHLTYEDPINNEQTQSISDELLEVLVKRSATFREAYDALRLAQEKLVNQTKPTAI